MVGCTNGSEDEYYSCRMVSIRDKGRCKQLLVYPICGAVRRPLEMVVVVEGPFDSPVLQLVVGDVRKLADVAGYSFERAHGPEAFECDFYDNLQLVVCQRYFDSTHCDLDTAMI